MKFIHGIVMMFGIVLFVRGIGIIFPSSYPYVIPFAWMGVGVVVGKYLFDLGIQYKDIQNSVMGDGKMVNLMAERLETGEGKCGVCGKELRWKNWKSGNAPYGTITFDHWGGEEEEIIVCKKDFEESKANILENKGASEDEKRASMIRAKLLEFEDGVNMARVSEYRKQENHIYGMEYVIGIISAYEELIEFFTQKAKK